MLSTVRAFILALFLALIAFAGGLYLGGHPERLPSGLRAIFVGEDRALRAEIESAINAYFFEKVDPASLEEGSLRGTVVALDDPFSNYFSPEDARGLRDSLSGNFDGIGVAIDAGKQGLEVLVVYEDTPAEGVDIQVGDLITEVDGESIAGEPPEVATAQIKGPAGTPVELTLVDPKTGRERTVTPKRASIEVPVVETSVEEVDGAKIGVIQLVTFSEGVHADVAKAVKKLTRQDVDGLVLDMRGNGGGLLTEAVLVASVFIEEGEIVATRGRTSPERVYEALGTAVDTETPMVVLVDRGTASSSEIVAGALRDSGRAEAIVGETTFGKGVFQEIIPLSNGGTVNLTVGSYFLPKGDNLADAGIEPEIKAVDDPRTESDEALPRALDELTSNLP